MKNMSRMEAMKYRIMEESSLSKEETMAVLKSPKRRRKKVTMTSWCGPQDWDHTSPTFWDHSTSKIQIQMWRIGANLPCFHLASLGLVFNGPNLYGLSNHTRPFTLSPKHEASSHSGRKACKKEASCFQENQKAVEKKDWHCKKEGHTKERCWILNPHLKPSKFR